MQPEARSAAKSLIVANSMFGRAAQGNWVDFKGATPISLSSASRMKPSSMPSASSRAWSTRGTTRCRMLIGAAVARDKHRVVDHATGLNVDISNAD